MIPLWMSMKMTSLKMNLVKETLLEKALIYQISKSKETLKCLTRASKTLQDTQITALKILFNLWRAEI